MDSEALLLVGRVSRPHGIHGEIKVSPETDDPLRIKGISKLYFGASSLRVLSKQVHSVRFQRSKNGTVVVLKLDGIDTREAAESFRKMKIFANRSDLPPLMDGEMYIHDLIGFSATTEFGEAVGTVIDVLETPAHLTFLVERDGRPDVLIPDVPEIITHIDLIEARIVIRPMEGLFEM